MPTTPTVAPQDVHPDFPPETLQAIRRARAGSRKPGAKTYSADEAFSDLGIDLASMRKSREQHKTG